MEHGKGARILEPFALADVVNQRRSVGRVPGLWIADVEKILREPERHLRGRASVERNRARVVHVAEHWLHQIAENAHLIPVEGVDSASVGEVVDIDALADCPRPRRRVGRRHQFGIVLSGVSHEPVNGPLFVDPDLIAVGRHGENLLVCVPDVDPTAARRIASPRKVPGFAYRSPPHAARIGRRRKRDQPPHELDEAPRRGSRVPVVAERDRRCLRCGVGYRIGH